MYVDTQSHTVLTICLTLVYTAQHMVEAEDMRTGLGLQVSESADYSASYSRWKLRVMLKNVLLALTVVNGL